MKRDDSNIEDVLRRGLPKAPRGQMETSLDRVYARLQASRNLTPVVPDTAVDPASFGRTRDAGWRPVWRLCLRAAAAAIVVAAGVWAGISLQDHGVYAVLEAADGSTYRVADGSRVPLFVGDRIAAQETIHADGATGAMLALADGSRVEMRSKSALAWEQAPDGLTVRLNSGSLIVDAARQAAGRLYVQTQDMTASVTGTSLVNAATDGSRVAVIQGEAHVRERGGTQGTIEKTLRPGEQVATSPTLAALSVKDEIAWSRNANAHRSILENFQTGMAKTAGPLLPVTPRVLNAQADKTVGAAPREFEEASIRPCDPSNVPPAPAGARGGGPNSLQMTPGRFHALCLTLATLIRTAYDLSVADLAFVNPGGRGRAMRFDPVYGLGIEDGRRVKGGPDWVRSEHYTIEAIADAGADAETMRTTFLRALLESRFRLRAHIESEDIPAFALVVAPGGLKMKEGTCTPSPDPPAAPVGGAMTNTADMVRKNLAAARRGETTVSPCGYYGAVNGPNMIFVGAGAGLPRMSNVSGAPILDRSGVPNTTSFNYVLEYSPDDTAGPLRDLPPEMQIAADPASVPRAPSLFTALEQQLGLRLEPTKAPRQYIMIDQVERLGPN